MRASSIIAPVYVTHPHIVNHDIMNCTADNVAGNHLYSGRALGITETDDILQLHPQLQSQWPAICAHYDRIGLSYTRKIIWNVDFQALGKYPDYQPSFFYYGEEQNTHSENGNWYQVVQYVNSKNNFMTLAEELGMDIPQTVGFDSIEQITARDLATFSYPCYLKAAVSVSGVGIYRCENRAELEQALVSFAKDVPVQIQEEVQARTFLNMQYRVRNDHLEKLAATEQILDGFTHQGNISPARCEPWQSVQPMAEWLYCHGIKGIFAFDVAVVEHRHQQRFMPIECNPRFNGASYPTLIAEKLGEKVWLARTFDTSKRNLKDIDLSGLEYDKQLGIGVVIVNWGPVMVGKLLCLLIGPPKVQHQLQLELERRLC